MMRFAITGGSGFIGSNLTKRLLKGNHHVTIIGSIKSSSSQRLKSILNKIDVKDVDLDDIEILKKELKGFDVVAHFGASASTKTGFQKTDVDLKRNIIATYNILEAMRTNGIRNLIFPSAPAVYGNPVRIPTPEDTGMLFPVSLYGAAKLASEGMISAFCHLFGMKAWIFRLGNVVGPDMTRGVIVDLIRKLKKDSDSLEILGDGNQKKDVIYIDDCIDGILFLFKKSRNVINVFNLSSGTVISVNKIAKIIQEEMNLKNVAVKHSGGSIGWPGDVPIIKYDITKIKKMGWKPKYTAEEAIRLTVRRILANN